MRWLSFMLRAGELHTKDEYKGKGIGTKIINQLKDYAIGAIHLNYYTGYEIQCEKLYWEL
ncbi:hypothetical protein [Fusobacterium mortiferum]|uniref:hypothetical protein n=1 Tax=Fusobacterium mortiferum TaxID=850 RepID=UPI003F8DD943